MTTDELRDAAMRLVRWSESDPSGMFYDAITEAEAVAMARAWLADHPADEDEPTTAEWLSQFCSWDDLKWRGVVPKVAWVHRDDERLGFRYTENGYGWAAYYLTADLFDGSEQYLTMVPTRGHVRRFVEVMSCHPRSDEVDEPTAVA
jgi:hypothetical protein